ncbi:hypothetical protein E4U55_006182 [Claviceps digitariae]|nr:hypothetical protein E4U55_006182 [Claviceps digitariae]
MASKREFLDLDQGETAEPESKRARRQTGATPRHQHQNSSIDPTWGQKYVFSSLEDATTIPYGEESDFEDDVDAMAYLQSVRKEAYNIPHLLVAPKVQIGPQLPPDAQQDEQVDINDAYGATSAAYTGEVMQGYYDDGAYIAMPDEDWNVDVEDDGQVDSDAAEADARIELLHESYYASVMKKYGRLRQLLHSKHPADWAKRLSSTQVTHAAAFGRNSSTNKAWAKLIRKTDPHPLQLAGMSKETVFEVLRIIMGGTFLRRGYTVSVRTSQWIWGLLARLPDRGELNHTEIGCIRDFGRHAVLLGVSLEQIAIMRDAMLDGELGAYGGIVADGNDEDVLSPTEGEDTDSDAKDDHRVSRRRSRPKDGQGSMSDDDERNRTADGLINEKDGESRGKQEGEQMGEQEQEQEQEQEEEEEEEEDGEIQEQSLSGDDVAMDMDSGSEDGEARDEEDDLEAAKSGLLARLDEATGAERPLEENEEAQNEARLQLRMNMRATLSMILTIAGEFYGQRDLLDFRSPFIGL